VIAKLKLQYYESKQGFYSINKLVHISGKDNLVADALFRSPKDIPSHDDTNQAILLDDLRLTTPHYSHNEKLYLISTLQLDRQNL
jgi:hypothetical protein